MASKFSSMVFISSFSSGAPASPSSQQPPLHLCRSQTNLASITSSLIRTLSIAITVPVFTKVEEFRISFHANLQLLNLVSHPLQCFDQVFHILFQEIVDRFERICIGGGRKIKCATQEMLHRISGEELVTRSRISLQREINATRSIG